MRRTALLTVVSLLASLLPLSTALAVTTAGAGAWINELHYDNDGTDTGEFVEIAVLPGVDVTGWQLVLYNGNGGGTYGTATTLTASVSDAVQFVVTTYPSNGIQNGDADGIALVNGTGTVVQFLSYEGTLVATSGPAAGATSTDIGVEQPGSTPVGSSLQLTGSGGDYGDFSWAVTDANTAGVVNTGQTIDGSGDPDPDPDPGPDPAPAGSAWVNELHYDNVGADTGEFVEVAVVDGTDLTGWTVVLYNGNGGTPYGTKALPQTTTGSVDGVGFVEVAYPADGIQNGAPDGVAIVDGTGAVVQFLSYEGQITAVGGPADGMTSEDIGVSQTSSTPIGTTLQLTGTGTGYADFTWTSGPATPGAVNEGQSFGEPTEPDPEFPENVCEATADDLTLINEIQGAGSATPLAGQQVLTRGVVTADFTSGGASGLPNNQGLRGFFIEAVADDRDGDAATSEGVFVFDGGGEFDGVIGDLVHVIGTASEQFDVTQVSVSDFAVCADTGVDTTLPPPAALPLPTAPEDRAEVFEPLESMRVVHPELTVVEFFQIERFGEVRLSSGGVLQNPTNVVDPHDAAYETLVAYNAANNIILDDGRTGQNLDPLPYVEPGDTLRIGDQLRDETTVLHFGFSEWRLQPVDVDALTEEFRTNRTRPRPEAPPEVGGSLTVASFNVLNYFNGDGYFVGDDPDAAQGFPTSRGAVTPSEFERQTEKIVDAIVRMDADVFGLIEIENDGGEDQAAAALVDAVNTTLGSEVYDYLDTGPIGTDEIKLAFVYKPATVTPTGDFAVLDSSVDPRFEDQRNRPALAQTFTEVATGEAVTIAVNHLKSKGSACDAPDNDPRQGNCNGVRLRAAQALADWLASDPTGEEARGSLIIGDLNAYAQEDPIEALESAGYTDLLEAYADGTTPYTYTFDATQGYLDHALADADLVEYVTGAAPWHINADEVPAIDYQEFGPGRFRTDEVAQLYYDPSAFRSSDHDPVIVGLDLGDPAPTHPTSKDECKNGGWREFTDPTFRNQGQCVAWVVTQQIREVLLDFLERIFRRWF